MKRIVSLMIAPVLLASLSLSGCGGAQNGKVEITVVTPFGGEDGNHANYVSAYKAYEERTGNTVKDLSGISNEEWKQQLISDMKNGNEPDVIFFFTGADADSLIRDGKVVPVSDIRKYNEGYAANMKSSMLPVSAVDGRQYAVPVNGYWEGLYVNKKVLADCGVELPDGDYGWERFLEDCRVIRDKGYTPIAASLNEVPHYWFEFCTFNYGDIYNHNALPSGSGDEIGGIWARGLGDIKLLYEGGFFPENTNSITDGEANLLMTENKAAFMLDGSWKLGWLQENAENIDDFTVTYVPAKGERKQTDIIGGLSMGYYITRKAWDDPKKRAACVDFVMAMTKDEVVSAFGALSVTALKNGTKQPDGANGLVTAAIEMTKGCTGIATAVQDGLSLDARNDLFANVKNIVTGDLSPERAIDRCLDINGGAVVAE